MLSQVNDMELYFCKLESVHYFEVTWVNREREVLALLWQSDTGSQKPAVASIWWVLWGHSLPSAQHSGL